MGANNLVNNGKLGNYTIKERTKVSEVSYNFNFCSCS